MVDVSVIIPTFNRSDRLRRALESLAALDPVDDPFEIIVVDNGSTDDTKPVTNSFGEQHPGLDLKYVFEPIPGLLAGRHRGAKEASGDILSYIDDDAAVSPAWMEGIQAVFRDSELVLAGGPCIPEFQSQPPTWLEHLWTEHPLGRYLPQLSLLDFGATQLQVEPKFIWGLNFSIRRTTLKDVGGFHPDNMPRKLELLQGDGETGVSARIKGNGGLTLYDPRISVDHLVPTERMSREYFRSWHRYAGIAHSYSEIRRSPDCLAELARYLESTLSKQKNKAAIRSFLPSRAKLIRSEGGVQFTKGRLDHLRACMDHHEIFDWVTRDNYWDYSLPIGYQAH